MDTPKANEVHHEEVVQLGREEVVPLCHVPKPASSIRAAFTLSQFTRGKT